MGICHASKDEIAALPTIYDTYKAKGILFYRVLVRVDGGKDADVLADARIGFDASLGAEAIKTVVTAEALFS